MSAMTSLAAEITVLSQSGNAADTLMLCASWVAQADLSEFFKEMESGRKCLPASGASEMSFEGGVSQSAYNTLAAMHLSKPERAGNH